MKCFRAALLLMIACAAMARPARCVLEDQRGPTEAVAPENSPEFVTLFQVTFDNTRGGAITAGPEGAETVIGKVLAPANAVNDQGYTASGWAPEGRVAATAVNAVHLKLKNTAPKATIMSILPKELFANPSDFNAMYKSSASIITDMPGGTGFFGGAFAPFIGSPVLADRGEGFKQIEPDFVPAEGDRIRILVQRPKRFPAAITFENRFGGRVILRYADGEEKVIAQVLKPVYGVGRFGGSEFADVGRIRANHTGVICVSASPVGQIGGFQIIPENHGMSPEMSTARTLTQWMVVGPKNIDDPSTEGVAPLFRYFLRPVYYPLGAEGRSIEQMMDMFIVQVQRAHGPWERMPEFTGRNDTAMPDLTAIRILFPLDMDLLSD